jgi:TatD DNase family protein
MRLIDTHVHINFDVFQGELTSLSSRWREAGVVHLIHSCVEPSEFSQIQAIADQFPELSFAVGLHPLDVHKWTEATSAEILAKASSDPRVVAIGEIGLDYYKAENKELQKKVLEAQLLIAKKLDKPVIIHCREAAEQLRGFLTNFWEQHGPVPGVMHCWGGNPEETQWFLDLGFYISFSGIVTFKNAVIVKESAKIVPNNRLLIETDCPFLAPVPQRGKRNEPANVSYVAEYLASLRQIPLEILAEETTRNADNLFHLNLKIN